MEFIIVRGLFCVFAVVSGFLSIVNSALADVKVEVDVGSQTMDVYVNGSHRHSWRVSTGRRGYDTPRGTYRVKRLEREWYSTIYDDAPMPYSIFFKGGYAIHGTYHIKRRGYRASHGCVRLAPKHAARLFSLVRSHGTARTRISVYD